MKPFTAFEHRNEFRGVAELGVLTLGGLDSVTHHSVINIEDPQLLAMLLDRLAVVGLAEAASAPIPAS